MSKKTKAKKGTLGESPFKATTCSFCKHAYIFPCNGERYDCGNAVWVRSKGKIDVGRLTDDERSKLVKTGKLPNVNTHERKPVEQKVKRIKLTEKPKKKKRRVRL